MTGTGFRTNEELYAGSDAVQATRQRWERLRPSRTTHSRLFLDGASLTPMAWILVACGTMGGLLFSTTYLIEGATRAGYDPWVRPSARSAWVQAAGCSGRTSPYSAWPSSPQRSAGAGFSARGLAPGLTPCFVASPG